MVYARVLIPGWYLGRPPAFIYLGRFVPLKKIESVYSSPLS